MAGWLDGWVAGRLHRWMVALHCVAHGLRQPRPVNTHGGPGMPMARWLEARVRTEVAK